MSDSAVFIICLASLCGLVVLRTFVLRVLRLRIEAARVRQEGLAAERAATQRRERKFPFPRGDGTYTP